MKQRPPRGRTGCSTAFYHSFASLIITLCYFLPKVADAQPPTNSQFYNFYNTSIPNNGWKDVKGFSTEIIGTTRESVMAGTIYDPNNFYGNPIFVHYDPCLATPGVYPDISNSGNDVVIYNDPSFYDHRVVDIAVCSTAANATTCVMTMSAREDASLPGIRQDKIRVLGVDVNGNPTGLDFTIFDTRNTGSGSWGYSLYPQHTIYKYANSKNILYICGFVAEAQTTGVPWSTGPVLISTIPAPPPPYADFTTPKQAFVMAVDLDAGPTNCIVACKYYNWAYTGGTTNSPEYDFDIAMRMTELSSGYASGFGTPSGWAGDIHVTGSVCAKTGVHNGPPQPVTFIRSGTMNMIVDDVTLAVQPFSDNPFISAGNGDGIGPSEYGVGYVEGTAPADHYIVSNLYYGQPNANPGGLGSYTWIGNYGAFNLKPDVFTVTHANHWNLTTNGSPLNQRRKSNLGWALQTLPPSVTAMGSYNSTEARTLIAGMMHTDPTGSMMPAPSNNNIIPFLYEEDFYFSVYGPGAFVGNTSEGGNDYGMAYLNLTGTGIPGTNTNNYLTLSYDYSSVLWGPTFAARYDATQDVVLNAPKWDQHNPSLAGSVVGTDFLGKKAMFADVYSYDFGYPGCTQAFNNLTYSSEYIEHTNTNVSETTISQPIGVDAVLGGYTANGPSPFDYYGDCTGAYHGFGNQVYKQGTTSVTRIANSKTMIFPNPARDAISIALASNISTDAKIKVELFNMQGQSVGILFNGTAAKMINKLQLPEVASGLYIVKVFNNGNTVHQEKLTIQQ